jgi:Ran GTPase-activating protein (RanGAP) involved in mRNA processing and transport
MILMKTKMKSFKWGLVFLFLIFPLGTYGQIFDEEKVDYDKLFEQHLSSNGKTLNLAGKKIGDEGVKILLSHEILQKVTKLDLRYNEITKNGAKLMADSKSLSNLKTLELRHNFLADAGAKLIAQSENFNSLKELKLGWNEIRDAGAIAFTEQKIKNLTKLDLRGNFLSNGTKTALKNTLSHFKKLLLY